MPLLMVATAILLLRSSSAAESGDTVPGPIPAEITRVIDGDTIAVKARIWLGQEVETHVRILGIDAPELKARCEHEREMAEEARAKLTDIVSDGQVTLKDIRADKYGGRVLAMVETAKGQSVGDLMLHSGLARAYDGGTRQPWCAMGEAER